MSGLQCSDKTLITPPEMWKSFNKISLEQVPFSLFIQAAFPDALLCTSDSVYAVDDSGGSCLHGAYTVIKEMRIRKQQLK